MKKHLIAFAVAALACTASRAQETPVAIGISGGTSFSPLTLAEEAAAMPLEAGIRQT